MRHSCAHALCEERGTPSGRGFTHNAIVLALPQKWRFMENPRPKNYQLAHEALTEFFEAHREELERLRSDDPEEDRANFEGFLRRLGETEGELEIPLSEPGSEADNDPFVRLLRKRLEARQNRKDTQGHSEGASGTKPITQKEKP